MPQTPSPNPSLNPLTAVADRVNQAAGTLVPPQAPAPQPPPSWLQRLAAVLAMQKAAPAPQGLPPAQGRDIYLGTTPGGKIFADSMNAANDYLRQQALQGRK